MPYSRIPALIAQATVGFIFGTVLVLIARLLLVHGPRDAEYALTVPFILFFAPLIGTPAGLSIWICARVTDHPLNRTYRCGIGLLVQAVFWFGYKWLAQWTPYSSAKQTLFLLAIVFPGIGIGLVTNSRLRLWHELVRKGEATSAIPQMFAGLTGLILRPLVVVFSVICLIAFVAIFQSDYYQHEDRVWSALFLAHFTGGFALLFWRMRIPVLLPLALLVNVPMILAVFSYKYFVGDLWPLPVVYLGVWAVFLVSRLRQIDFVLSFLNEEIHYYLID